MVDSDLKDWKFLTSVSTGFRKGLTLGISGIEVLFPGSVPSSIDGAVSSGPAPIFGLTADAPSMLREEKSCLNILDIGCLLTRVRK